VLYKQLVPADRSWHLFRERTKVIIDWGKYSTITIEERLHGLGDEIDPLLHILEL